MKYATKISEFLNAFSLEPLKRDQMAEFYCEDTMEYRTGDPYSSPMDDIFRECQKDNADNAFLLLGHRGCGKSTELNRLSEKLEKAGYKVKTIICSLDLDLINLACSDLFIMMGEALLQIATECHCAIDEAVLESIQTFWLKGTRTKTILESETEELEAGLSAGTSGIFGSLLNIFATIKAHLKFNEETRVEFRGEISARTSEWIRLLKRVSDEIRSSSQKTPFLIFEDLDKLDSEDAGKIFYNNEAKLSGMPFPVIYTFPIALSYDPRFAALEARFTTEILPMVKIKTIQGERFDDGIDAIQEIVAKRADSTLFEEGVLERLICFTGGSLRELFLAINTSAKRAERRRSATIAMEDANRALTELQTSLTRRIEQNDYAFLAEICNGNKQRIENKKKLLEMLQALVVLEYNGERWHDVHPLVAEFLRDQKLIPKKQETEQNVEE